MSARLAAAIAGLALFAASPKAMAQGQEFDVIERGHVLATVGDCVACHTAPGGKPFSGGLKIETPFGIIASPNITPDMDTGIGRWTDAEFVRAMHEGIGRNGEHLYPAFPYPYYTKVTTSDVLAIRAWLATIPAVRNEVVSNQLPFPFSIRADLIGWNGLNFKEGRFVPSAAKPAVWNRGAYLVEGLGHCGACHTEKNVIGGDKSDRALLGGTLGGWFAPNIGGDMRRGVGGWSNEQIVAYLKTGHNDVAAASGPMADVVTQSTSRMAPADLQAIAVYLRDQPPPQDEPTAKPDDVVMKTGGRVYATQCAACHTQPGSGVNGLFPTLAHAPNIQSINPTTLIRAVLQGAKSVATDPAPTGAAMPAFDWKLSDEQVAAALTYVRWSWGNSAPSVTSSQVADIRKALRKEGD